MPSVLRTVVPFVFVCACTVSNPDPNHGGTGLGGDAGDTDPGDTSPGDGEPSDSDVGDVDPGDTDPGDTLPGDSDLPDPGADYEVVTCPGASAGASCTVSGSGSALVI